MPGGSVLGPAAGVVELLLLGVLLFFFANMPLTSLLPKALAADPRIEPPTPLPAALAAAAPAPWPAAPADALAPALAPAELASPTTLPFAPPPLADEFCAFLAAAQLGPPNAIRSVVLSG